MESLFIRQQESLGPQQCTLDPLRISGLTEWLVGIRSCFPASFMGLRVSTCGPAQSAGDNSKFSQPIQDVVAFDNSTYIELHVVVYCVCRYVCRYALACLAVFGQGVVMEAFMGYLGQTANVLFGRCCSPICPSWRHGAGRGTKKLRMQFGTYMNKMRAALNRSASERRPEPLTSVHLPS